MSNHVKCDLGQLKEYKKKLEALQTRVEPLCETCAKELASIMLRLVKKRTPVGKAPKLDGPESVNIKLKGADGKIRKRAFLTADGARMQKYWSGYTGGTLRRSWTCGEIEKIGNTYLITVKNPEEYASYVEYGHRQKPGRYVPALGKSLVHGWVRGKFMMTISEQELQKMKPAFLEAKLKKELEEALK